MFPVDANQNSEDEKISGDIKPQEPGSPTSTDYNCGDGAKLWNPGFDQV